MPRSAYVELRHIAGEIPVGTTDTSRTCPFCGGGRNGDRGFSITRTDEATVLYICHRATCHRSGRVAAWGHRLPLLDTSQEDRPKDKPFTPRVYTGDTGELDSEWLSEILGRYGLEPTEAARAMWRVGGDDGLLVCPVLSPTGIRRGVETRRSKTRPGSGGGAKTGTYKELDEPWMGWYRGIRADPVVIVEDLVSALKVSRWYQAVSLMGSHVGLDHVQEILGVTENAVLALDRDATDRAIEYIQEWRLLIPNFRMVHLSKDLKYQSDEEILTLIGD